MPVTRVAALTSSKEIISSSTARLRNTQSFSRIYRNVMAILQNELFRIVT